MTQKTFITSKKFAVGDEVILIEEYREDNCSSSWWDAYRHTGSGVPGNMDREVKRYHGWRGTSYGVSLTAHGVRRVLKVVDLGDNPEVMEHQYKITVGKDLHPDWE
ncbi:hypothetical protein [Ruthenibacterium lactatiformans]|uniref:hypothetical protein n=1 Tax=Ruthenibacterium lactatiformans TaxID=1550024 RepID=UPI00267373D5|nr:hypothetical protein [Ruthenibacterium lactatiformans]